MREHSRRNRTPRAHVDRYAPLADVGRTRRRLTTRADECEANADDPTPYNRKHFVYTKAADWADEAARLDTRIGQVDTYVEELRDTLRGSR